VDFKVPKGKGFGTMGEEHAAKPTVLSIGSVFSDVQMQYSDSSTHSELERPKPPLPAETQYFTMPETLNLTNSI
jgi:hypothetical protein